jgi:hypothetical protein
VDELDSILEYLFDPKLNMMDYLKILHISDNEDERTVSQSEIFNSSQLMDMCNKVESLPSENKWAKIHNSRIDNLLSSQLEKDILRPNSNNLLEPKAALAYKMIMAKKKRCPAWLNSGTHSIAPLQVSEACFAFLFARHLLVEPVKTPTCDQDCYRCSNCYLKTDIVGNISHYATCPHGNGITARRHNAIADEITTFFKRSFSEPIEVTVEKVLRSDAPKVIVDITVKNGDSLHDFDVTIFNTTSQTALRAYPIYNQHGVDNALTVPRQLKNKRYRDAGFPNVIPLVFDINGLPDKYTSEFFDSKFSTLGITPNHKFDNALKWLNKKIDIICGYHLALQFHSFMSSSLGKSFNTYGSC